MPQLATVYPRSRPTYQDDYDSTKHEITSFPRLNVSPLRQLVINYEVASLGTWKIGQYRLREVIYWISTRAEFLVDRSQSGGIQVHRFALVRWKLLEARATLQCQRRFLARGSDVRLYRGIKVHEDELARHERRAAAGVKRATDYARAWRESFQLIANSLIPRCSQLRGAAARLYVHGRAPRSIINYIGTYILRLDIVRSAAHKNSFILIHRD